MNIVDSSGWLEYFADGSNAAVFAPLIEKQAQLLIPSIILYEVFKVIMQQRGEGQALQAMAIMQQGEIIDITAEIAINAANISVSFKLPMADSLIYAISLLYKATLYTQDSDFKNL